MPSDPRFTPTAIKAPHGSDTMTIGWADGQTFELSHIIMRGYCPCAHCQGHAGPATFQEGVNLELVDVAQVGTYALQPTWGDRHDTGIYTFRYLRALCQLDPRERRNLIDGVPVDE